MYKNLIIVLLCFTTFCACKPVQQSPVDFPLPPSAELINVFNDNSMDSYLFTSKDSLEQIVEFFVSSMETTKYNLVSNESISDSNITLTYDFDGRQFIISILNTPTNGSNSTFTIVFPKSAIQEN